MYIYIYMYIYVDMCIYICICYKSLRLQASVPPLRPRARQIEPITGPAPRPRELGFFSIRVVKDGSKSVGKN